MIRRLDMDVLTNRGIEVTLKEIKKEMSELKRKMRELTKTEREGEGARGQKDRKSDQEGRRASRERVRAGSRLQKVDNLTGVRLVPGGPRKANERSEVGVKSEPVSRLSLC